MHLNLFKNYRKELEEIQKRMQYADKPTLNEYITYCLAVEKKIYKQIALHEVDKKSEQLVIDLELCQKLIKALKKKLN